MKMKAAILHEQGREHPFTQSKALSVEEVELDPPGEGEVLIKTGAAGLCHSDLSMINGTMQRKLPMVPGHEAAGVVEEIGKNVTQCKVGDHVVMSFVPICGKCEFCTTGRSNLCETAFNARATGALINGERRLSLNGGTLHHTNGVSIFSGHGWFVPPDRRPSFEKETTPAIRCQLRLSSAGPCGHESTIREGHG